MSRKRKSLSVETFKSHAAEDVLRAALTELGWKNVTAAASAGKDTCDVYWRGLDVGEPWTPPEGSYVARIPGMSALSRKAEMATHLNRLRHHFPDDFNFYPQTWLIPEEQAKFEAHAHKQRDAGKVTTYIIKPDGGAQGEGIFLIQNPRDLCTSHLPSIVQEYLPKPFLLRGLKFDLRLYVLVSSIDPLEVYLSESGMARFCTMPYQPPSVTNLHQTFMHLTNYSLNKRSKDYVHSGEADKGSKQTFASVLAELEALGKDVREVWDRIGQLVCRTIVAALPQLMVDGRAYQVEHSLGKPPKGFQVLGFDILLDHRLQPHLLEVNAHPSLRVDFEQPVRPGVVEYVPSPVDLEIKLPVVKDTLRIIGSKIKGKCPPEHTSFRELLPAHLEDYAHLRVFERAAQLFSHFVGVRGGVKMGSTAFRAFTRHCGLCDSNFTSADVDILYIDTCRRHVNTLERNALSFHGYCEALMAMASKIYGGEVSIATTLQLIERCEQALPKS